MTRFDSFRCVILLGLSAPAGRAADPTEFFETRVRPVLVEHCVGCHGPDKQKGGLRLDSRDAARTGGDTGPAVAPGAPEKSLLVKAVRYADPDLRMPPKGKLAPDQIAALEDWVKAGAVDPRTGTAAAGLPGIGELMARATDHWSFRPVREPTVPAGAAHPVDAFLLAKLTAAGLTFAPPADKRTLIRRATFDLHGLPPTPEEVDAFVRDETPDAYGRLIDRLLASPRYGERWGRHWLDVARYADDPGEIFNNRSKYPHAWTYRDYVVRSLNEDKPYDQFVREQLAADLLPRPAGDDRSLAALGFVTVGRRPYGRPDDDVIDDRIDAVSRGLLGLTAGCARCHDHKLEPIPTADYYALYGVFKSCTEPEDLPVLVPPPDGDPAARKAFADENERARRAVVEVQVRAASEALAAVRGRVGDYLIVAAGVERGTATKGKLSKAEVNKRKLNNTVYNQTVANWGKWVVGNPSVFGPWLAFEALTPDEFAAGAKAVAIDESVHPLVAKKFAEPPASLEDVAKRYNELFAEVDGDWRKLAADALKKAAELRPDDLRLSLKALQVAAVGRVYDPERAVPLPDPAREKLRQVLTGPDSPFVVRPEVFGGARLMAQEIGNELVRAGRVLTALDTHPGAPARAMVVAEAKPYAAKVFVRGNPKLTGADAPRQFFAVLSGPDRKPFPKDVSGRLELANAIASPDNPLTARVLVNRIWMWHFGRPLVGTPSDFGFRGEAPSHPELLDWLAARFVADGWSWKALHRTLMLSAAYQQTSRIADCGVRNAKSKPGTPASIPQSAIRNPQSTDPENRLYWRMNPRPLEFEAFRDAVLAASGRLDPRVGGRPEDATDGAAARRSVYAVVDRKNLPGVFRSFDFPDPNFTAAGRPHTDLPPKALFLLNNPFLAVNARALAARAVPKTPEDRAATVARLYRLAYQRGPEPGEAARALAYLDRYPAGDVVVPEASAWSYGTAEYDPDARRVVGFAPFTKASDAAVTDGKAGAEITPDGGKPAKAKAAVRRWTAPVDGEVDVSAELTHAGKAGDGVVCRVVSSRHGPLGEWAVKDSSASTLLKGIEVQKGDVLDFLTAAGADAEGDAFRWAPVVAMPGRDIPAMPGVAMRWDAKAHFQAPGRAPVPLTAWEELAQALLLADEFALAE